MYVDSNEQPPLKIFDQAVSRKNFHLAVRPEVLGTDVGVVMYYDPSRTKNAPRWGMIYADRAFEIPPGVDQHLHAGDLVSFTHRDSIAENIRVITPAQHVFGGMQVFRNNYKN